VWGVVCLSHRWDPTVKLGPLGDAHLPVYYVYEAPVGGQLGPPSVPPRLVCLETGRAVDIRALVEYEVWAWCTTSSSSSSSSSPPPDDASARCKLVLGKVVSKRGEDRVEVAVWDVAPAAPDSSSHARNGQQLRAANKLG
jgi:hypothetical protein